MTTLAPIVLFVYNRPEHTRKIVEYLSKNRLAESSDLFIFSDGPKTENDKNKVSEVREFIRSINGFKEIKIIERKKNLGLANSVIQGANEILESYNKIIILEDDIVTAIDFLKYMNDALTFYENEEYVFSISGYTYPIRLPEYYNQDVFLAYRSSSWGWATWKDRWEKTDWRLKDIESFFRNKFEQKKFNQGGEDLTPMLHNQLKGNIDSWGIRWAYAQFLNNSYCLYPRVSLTKNIGMDWSGTHSSGSKKYDVELAKPDTEIQMSKNLQLNNEINERIRKIFKPSMVRRIINYFKLKSW
jgi:hypothetical protein